MRIEAICLIALGVAAVAAGGLALVETLFAQKALLTPIEAAIATALYTLLYGVGPVVLIGAPVYTLLVGYKANTWWAVLLVGLVPESSLAWIDRSIGIYACVCGIVIATVTHARWQRVNKN